MSISTLFNQKILSVIQTYALSEDKTQFLNSLPQGMEKSILTALLLPYTDKLTQQLQNGGIPYTLITQIIERKLYDRVQSAKSISDIGDIYDELKRKYAENIQHPRPTQTRRKQPVKNSTNQSEEKIEMIIKHPSKLELEQASSFPEHLLQILKKNKSKLDNFSSYALRNLPEDFLMSMEINEKAKIVSENLLSTFNPSFANKFLSKFIEEMSQKQKYEYQVSQYIYRTLPIEHIQEIVRSNPKLLTNSGFLPVWFSTVHEKQSPLLTTNNESLTFGQKEEKRKLFCSILKQLQKIPKTPTRDSIIKQIELEVLTLDVSVDDPDLQRFVNYLMKTNDHDVLLKYQWRQKVSLNNVSTTQLLSNLPTTRLNLRSFFDLYIFALFDKYDSHKYKQIDQKLLEIFDEGWYKRLKAMKLLSKGEQQNEKVLSEEQKLEIRQKKQLTICKSNKTSFKPQQEVTLKLKIKNIEKLNIKIYELHLQKHYLQNKGEIKDEIDLHFLDPTYKFTYEIDNKNPFKQQIYDLPLEQIKKQRGVYIVDIDGSDLSSRAVIRKGEIFCLTKTTVAGVELTFIDEVGKKIQDLKIWARGQMIQVKGSYIFPFSSARQNLEIISVVGQFAQTFAVQIPGEAYNLIINPYYNKQSFIVGSKAKIILSPRLYLVQQNSRESQIGVSLKLLKNVRLNVTLTDHEGIRSIINFQNIKLSYEQDYVIDLPIQTYIRNIEINGMAEVAKLNGDNQILPFSLNIPITFSDEVGPIHQYYLRNYQGNYIIHVLGMDGQPIKNLNVPIQLKYQWIQGFDQFLLETDEKGQINLGPLNYVQTVVIQENRRQWQIGSINGCSQILNKMCFREGQVIKIPLPPTTHKIVLGSDVNIFSRSKDSNIANLNNLVKVSPAFLQISGLSKGIYSISILSLNYTGSIVVLRGEQWENPNQLYDKESSIIYQFLRDSNHYLSLGEPKIEVSENGNNKISLQIIKPEGVQIKKNVKVHVFAYSFIPTQMLNSSIMTVSKNDARSNQFKSKGNSYLNNKKLSEQAAYVLGRKQQKQFVGNNLQKPHILLKRIKVRDTVQKQENMRKQEKFKDKVINQNQNNLIDLLDCDFAPSQSSSSAQVQQQRATLMPLQSFITSHNNFLQFSGLALDNIKGSHLQFTLPNCYNYISVVLTSSTSQSARNVIIKNSEIKRKKLSHVGLPKQYNQNCSWSMSREVYSVGNGQRRKVNRNSRWCAVSLSNILRFAKAQSVKIDEWIERWCSYTPQLKLQIYNKNVCHELNSYIKHQDEDFFNKVVQPFIKNKLNKTFVDLCLIEDQSCEQWASLQYFDQLNQFEKVLLIQYLAKKGKTKEATKLAKSMELISKTNKENYAIFKDKFQSMLNVDVSSSRPDPVNLISPPPHPPPPLMSMAYSSHPKQQQLYGFNTVTSTTFNYNNQPVSYCNIPPPPPPPGVGGLFGGMGVAPRAPASVTTTRMAMPVQRNAMRFQDFDSMVDESSLIEKRSTFIQQFKQVQNTSEYTQVTYSQMKSPAQNNKNLIPKSKFWSDLALHFAQVKNKNNFVEQTFLNESILYLTGKLSFTLAVAFLPKNINPDYELSSQANQLILTANKPFLLLVKQIKQIPFNPKSGIMINHRFIDPKDRYTYEEDGSRIEKQVDEFITGNSYTLQTLVTNTTSNTLEVQLLVDIPQGAIPLRTKQYTQVVSRTVSAYSTQSFERQFYFPCVGQFNLYSANACWVKSVIAKAANLPKLQVKQKRTSKKLQTFMDVLEQGETDDILSFISTKNIFDSNIFRPDEILWMMKQKEKYEKIIQIFRQRGYINLNSLRFGFLHKDLATIKQYLALMGKKAPSSQINDQSLRIFEYYPYYSSRAHKYENANKSKIRNVEFKQTYYRFLFEQITFFNCSNKISFKLVSSYFLLLQDRIDEASKIIKSLTQAEISQYQLQFDYLYCFLDMYEGFPSFAKARKIVEKYENYPVSSWRVLFDEVRKTLKSFDNTVYFQDQQRKVQFRTTIVNEGYALRISIPENHRVQVLLHSINLELVFSENPFSEVKQCHSVRPAKVVVYQAGQSREEKLKWLDEFKDVIVEVFESGKNTYLRKVDSLLWTNPKLKVKVNEKIGSLQVFYQNKPISGNYCKVYSTGSKGVKFYRDGYTDITGSFRYALSELGQINRFSVLCANENGGIICKPAKPSQAGELSQF